MRLPSVFATTEAATFEKLDSVRYVTRRVPLRMQQTSQLCCQNIVVLQKVEWMDVVSSCCA